VREGAPEILGGLLLMTPPEIRAAAVFALGCLVQPAPDGAVRQPELCMSEQAIASYLLKVVYDASPLVRAELAVGLAR
jgi:hypothetical protein